MNKQRITIWVFSQQPLFRQGIRDSISQVKDIDITGESRVTDKISLTVEVMPPDVAIVDIDTYPDSGINLANKLKQITPSTALVVLASNVNEDQLFEAIKSNVSAYLCKDVNGNELIDIIRRVAHGEYPISDNLNEHPKVAEKILNQFQSLTKQQEVESLISPLTSRETEIVDYMSQGYANKQIAVKLSISEQTIKNHITSILNKLDANARTEAVVKALRRGLITLQKE